MWILLVGYSLLALGNLFFFIPSLPEVLESVRRKERISSQNHLLNDKASGIYNAFYAVGAIFAPITGGFLKDRIGYRETNDTIACLSAFFALIYILFNTRPSDYRCKRKKSAAKRTLKKLLEGPVMLESESDSKLKLVMYEETSSKKLQANKT